MPEFALNPIEAGEKRLASVFSDEYAFEIPPYQRPYAWEIEQARDLLDDLVEAMNNQRTTGGVYFLGSIVLIKQHGRPESKVVDGQQRLTTLTILISVLRDLTSDLERKIERRGYVFQKASPDKGTSDRFRLLLRERDRAFFLENIQRPDSTLKLPAVEALEGSRARIVENARYYHETLKAMPETDRDRLIAFIIQRCYLVVVAVPTQDTARRIFTVLNARGLDLAPTDMLKAELLERVKSPQEEAQLAGQWEDIERNLDRDGFVDVFTHIRMIRERDKPRNALEIGFAAAVPEFKGDPSRFMSDLLEPYSDALELLGNVKEFEGRFGAKALNHLRCLQRIDNKDWVAPALLCLRKASANSGFDATEFLERLERIAYFLFVSRATPNDRIQRYIDVMDEIDPREGRLAKSTGLKLTKEERSVFIAALDGPIYKSSRVCKPILLKLDSELSGGGATYEANLTIEHVLPQTVNNGSEWSKLFPSLTDRDEWTHRLANLVLLTRRANSSASNWDFEKKKAKYFQSKDGRSPFPLTQTVLDQPQWKVDVLRSRQSDLVAKLSTAWNLERFAIQG